MTHLRRTILFHLPPDDVRQVRIFVNDELRDSAGYWCPALLAMLLSPTSYTAFLSFKGDTRRYKKFVESLTLVEQLSLP